jgi:hypothetical protein
MIMWDTLVIHQIILKSLYRISSPRITTGFKFTDTLLKPALITKRFLQEISDFLVILTRDLLQYSPDEVE